MSETNNIKSLISQERKRAKAAREAEAEAAGVLGFAREQAIASNVRLVLGPLAARQREERDVAKRADHLRRQVAGWRAYERSAPSKARPYVTAVIEHATRLIGHLDAGEYVEALSVAGDLDHKTKRAAAALDGIAKGLEGRAIEAAEQRRDALREIERCIDAPE